MDKHEIINTILLIALISLLCFALYFALPDRLNINLKTAPQSELEITKDCENLSLEDSAYCFRNNIAKIYQYVITKDSIDLTFDELAEQGGDCRNWALLYESLCEETEYYCKYVVIKNKIKTGHAFLVMSGADGYCILDQTAITCAISEDDDE